MLRLASLFVLLVGLAVLYPATSYAQSTSQPHTVVSVRANQGFLMTHRPGMRALLEEPVRAVELDWAVSVQGRPGIPLRENDYVGLSFMVWNLGSPKHLGTGYSLAPYLRISVVESKRFSLNWRGVVGVGFVSKPFDRESNYKNIAIGSRLNAHMATSLLAEYQLTRRLATSATLGFYHMSNAAWKLPNLGINMPMAGLGFGWRIAGADKSGETPPERKKLLGDYPNLWNIWLAGGPKEIGLPGSPKYLGATLGVDRLFPLGKHWGLSASANFFHDGGTLARVLDDFEARGSFADHNSAALMSQIVFRAGRLSIGGGVGGLVLSKHVLEGRIVNRLVVQYQVAEKWSGNVGVKTHKAKADYIEMGLVYTLKRW